MKILLTGGGSGGHFYPILAIADSIQRIAKEEHLLSPRLWFVSAEPYDAGLLYEHGLRGKVIPTGKKRGYRSIKNFFDLFKTARAILSALFFLFQTYPDVIFGKGGYGSFPILFAARLLRIPVMIHESDTVPGRVNLWAAKFARRIAVSYPETVSRFPEKKTAWTGNPIRKNIIPENKNEAITFFKLEASVPTVLVLGGSLGAQKVNEVVLDALSSLLPHVQVIHQTGKNNFSEHKRLSDIALENSQWKSRYRPFAYLNDAELTMAASAADIVITRAGSVLFEIAAWGLPAVIIPITESHGNHQRENAYAYARRGGAIVMEEANVTPHLLAAEVTRLAKDAIERKKMSDATKELARLDAADIIGRELLNIALKHEV